MKFSIAWLQQFFDEPLPAATVLAEGLTSHVFEVESIESHDSDQVIDISITPNRGHDCLSHLGIARELAAIFTMPLKRDPLATLPQLLPRTDLISITLDPTICKRYIAGYIQGVTVGPSPQWLQERLAAIGQRSINNVVDATNFVMFTLGQPLHAFDAKKLSREQGRYAIAVEAVGNDQQFQALDGKEYTLSSLIPAIVDSNAKKIIGIAGIKGGTEASVDATTTDIIIESANFDGGTVRKAAQALKLRTDASQRFEQGLSPEICGYAMEMVVELILQVAHGEKVGFVDVYPTPQKLRLVSLSGTEIKQLIGVFGSEEIETAFTRLGFSFQKEGDIFTIQVPIERLDITLPEDLIEEVVRIIGYENVPALPLPVFHNVPVVNKNFYWTERIRTCLMSHGCSELYTSVFASSGDIVVLNKVDGNKPFLRNSLIPGLTEALEKNARNKDILGLSQVRVFEIGTVWPHKEEQIYLGIAVEKLSKKDTASDVLRELETYLGVPLSVQDSIEALEINFTELLKQLPEPSAYDPISIPVIHRYKPFSKYPFITRDIALWVSADTVTENILELLKQEAGELCVSVRLFDSFKKEERVSYAFRLIFQSFERTLLDEEVHRIMERISALLQKNGFDIR